MDDVFPLASQKMSGRWSRERKGGEEGQFSLVRKQKHHQAKQYTDLSRELTVCASMQDVCTT